jgi:hypothetical protein
MARVFRAGLAELPRIAAPGFALFRLAIKAQNERAMRLGQASKNGLQELGVVCRGGSQNGTPSKSSAGNWPG